MPTEGGGRQAAAPAAPAAASGSCIELDARERALWRATLLSDASRVLASLDVDAAIAALAQLVSREMGATCAIDSFDGDSAPRRTVASGAEAPRDVPVQLPSAVHEGRSLSFEDAGGAACVAVPVLARTGVIGAIVALAQPGARWDADRVDVLEEIARRLATALQNATLYREALAALQARDAFLSIAAHELRGPVTSMQLAVQGLQRHKVDAPKALAIIEREDKKIARLVDDLLEAARIRAGRMTFLPEDVDLDEVLQDSAAQLQGELRRSGSTLGIDAPERVGGHWDRMRLGQVVTNLLSNAIKFGRGRPVDVRVFGDDSSATLIVRDRGVGVSHEMLQRIFDPFERAVQAHRYAGLGLGLYIVRSIVQAMGGAVRAESEIDVGSTFTVWLPRRMP